MNILLDNRGLIRLEGEDARSFLQGLVTVDVLKITPAQPRYGALLSPQGKFLYDFFIYEIDGALVIDCPLEAKDSLAKKLTMYKLRAKVIITNMTGQYKVYYSDKEGFADPRSGKMGYRLLTAEVLESAPYAEYEHLRISAGIPEYGKELVPDKSFIMDNNFEELRGVDFDKGCYVGQEVTARVKYKGTTRKGLFVAEGAVAVGAVMAEDAEIGEMTSLAGGAGLARVKIEELAKAGELSVNGQKISLTKAQY